MVRGDDFVSKILIQASVILVKPVKFFHVFYANRDIIGQ